MKPKAQKTEKKKSTFVCAPDREGNRVGREKRARKGGKKIEIYAQAGSP